MDTYFEKFNTKRVFDQREIGLIYYDKEKKCLSGYLLPTFGGSSVTVEWDPVTGKSNLTPNSDLIKL